MTNVCCREKEFCCIKKEASDGGSALDFSMYKETGSSYGTNWKINYDGGQWNFYNKKAADKIYDFIKKNVDSYKKLTQKQITDFTYHSAKINSSKYGEAEIEEEDFGEAGRRETRKKAENIFNELLEKGYYTEGDREDVLYEMNQELGTGLSLAEIKNQLLFKIKAKKKKESYLKSDEYEIKESEFKKMSVSDFLDRSFKHTNTYIKFFTSSSIKKFTDEKNLFSKIEEGFYKTKPDADYLFDPNHDVTSNFSFFHHLQKLPINYEKFVDYFIDKAEGYFTGYVLEKMMEEKEFNTNKKLLANY